MNDLVRWIKTPRPYKRYQRSVVLTLIVINAAVFILQQFMPVIIKYLSLNPLLVVKQGHVWAVATYSFVHANFSHLLFNMLGLFFFGMQLERVWGSGEFLFLYLTIGILSGIISLVFYIIFKMWLVFLLGASGAVFGVMLAFTCLYPNAQIYIFGIFPVVARVLMIIYIILQLISLNNGASSKVAYLTHLAGIGVGWIYMIVRHGIDPYRRLFNK